MSFQFWWQEKERKTNQEAKPKVDREEMVYAVLKKIGRRNVFWCFQGIQYHNEFAGHYIFAGKDPSVSHWARLRQVKEGDLIIHACGGEIKSVSIAKSGCYEAPRPTVHFGMAFPENNKTGLKVDTEYKPLLYTLPLSNYRTDIVRLQGAFIQGKGYPFNKNGNGNQGYLFSMNKGLIDFFLGEVIKRNPDIGRWILAN